MSFKDDFNYIKIFSITFFVLISIIAIFNYFVDQYGAFYNEKNIPHIAKLMSNRNIIADVEHYNDRVLHRNIIKMDSEKRDFIVIGSSRVLQLRGRFVDSKSFYNHALMGAQLEDMISIVGIFKKEKGYIPKNILIDSHDEIFCDNRLLWWEPNIEYYNYMRKEFGMDMVKSSKSKYEKYLELINYENLKSNYKYFKTLIENDFNRFHILDSLNTEFYVKDKDGSLYFPKSIRDGYGSDKLFQLANSYRKKNHYFYKKEYEKLYKTFIKYLLSNGVNVYIYMSPLNPITYKNLSTINGLKDSKKLLKLTEDKVVSFAKESSLTYFGSYNSIKLGLDPNGYYDGTHPKDFTIERVLKFKEGEYINDK